MKKLTIVFLVALNLTGCYEKTPSQEEAIKIARQELAMAMCGSKNADCIKSATGKAHIGERLSDNTNKITVTFKDIVIRESKGAVPQSIPDGINSGMISYEFDAKNGETYIKEISLWSEDGKHSLELCGHNYTFCKK